MEQDKIFLDLNLRLLIAQHGKTQVSEALSAIEDVDLAVTRTEIETCGNKAKRSKARRRPGKSVEEIIRNAKPDNPETEGVIKRLAHAYENKEFLPELRDVRRFLESRSISPAKFRSRASALSAVVDVLARCKLDELDRLDRRRRTQGGDLGIIADQVLGHGAGYGGPV